MKQQTFIGILLYLFVFLIYLWFNQSKENLNVEKYIENIDLTAIQTVKRLRGKGC